MNSLVASILLLCASPSALARSWLTLYGYGGSTIAPKDNVTTNTTVSGTTTQSVNNNSDPSSGIYGAELVFQTPLFLGVGAAFEGMSYQHSDGSAADTYTALMVIPRLEFSVLIVDFWAGCGIGSGTLKLGNQTVTTGPTTVTYDKSSYTNPILSPRIGMDINLMSFSIGVQLAYTTTKADGTFTGTYNSTALTGNFSSSQSWLSAALRVGWNFF